MNDTLERPKITIEPREQAGRDQRKQSSLDAATVRGAAQYRWPSILAALQINVPNHPKKHGPCPACGGKDRFRLDDRDGRGSFYCNQCLPHAGDGLSLVMRTLGLSFSEALKAVAGALGLNPAQDSHSRLPLSPPPVRRDRQTHAFTCELAALDRRLRAARVLTALSVADCESLDDGTRDRLMVVACRAFDDLRQAERLEYIADLWRAKDFHERAGS